MKLEDERKNNPVPISTGNKLFFKNSRYSLEFDPNEGSYKLIINDVAKSDEGKYQCQVVTTPENVITADVVVKGWAHHMFSRILKPRIYEFLYKIEVFCLRSK